MKIVWLQHESFEGPGYIRAWADTHGHEITGVMAFEREPLPNLDSFDLLVVMGGPMSVHDDELFPWIMNEKRFLRDAIVAGKSVLGICLGAQLLADALGAGVRKNLYREIGWFDVRLSGAGKKTRLGKLLPEEFRAFHWHGDTFDVPAGAIHLGSSHACANQGFVWAERVVGLQFHNEVTEDSIRDLSGACMDEIDGSLFVQSLSDITNPAPVPDANRIMETILCYMESVTAGS